MLVEFVNAAVSDAQIGMLTPVVNSGKPFELDNVTAAAYIDAGILKAAAPVKEVKKPEVESGKESK